MKLALLEIWHKEVSTPDRVGATVFTRISAAALIKFLAPQVRRLFEGFAYLRTALIKKLDATNNLI